MNTGREERRGDEGRGVDSEKETEIKSPSGDHFTGWGKCSWGGEGARQMTE